MLNIMLILAWIVAFGLAMYLATRAVKFRLTGPTAEKSSSAGNSGILRDITALTRDNSVGCVRMMGWCWSMRSLRIVG